ncbi:MAG: hypothetical protein ACFFDN_16590 [Candidatus Hodarchaeota archaeon]
MQKNNITIALICAPGGHFEQMLNLSDFFNNYKHFWITKKNAQTESILKNEKKYYLSPSHFKKPWTYIPHFPKIMKIYWTEKPSHALSTGSGRTCFVPFLLAKLFNIKFIYIDTFSRVNNFTSFAIFLNKLGHPIFTQWRDNIKKNVSYIGPLFKEEKINNINNSKEEHIFVTVGNRLEPFVRILESVEMLVNKGIITEKVVLQAGNTKYESNRMEIFDWCDTKRIDDLIQHAKYVITQESAGIASKCLRFKKKFIEMPRDYAFGELPAQGDMKEDLQFKLEELGYTKVVNNTAELEMAIKNIDKLKTGFKFDNRLAISTLTNLVEK